jgi:hypothetical protein
MLAPLDSDQPADFAAALDPVNAAAEAADGLGRDAVVNTVGKYPQCC